MNSILRGINSSKKSITENNKNMSWTRTSSPVSWEHGGTRAPTGALGSEREEIDENPVANAIARRIFLRHMNLISEYGLERVLMAIEDVASSVGRVEEIGSSDVSEWVRRVERSLSEDLTEGTGLSKELLARYKKLAGQAAREADSRGDYDLGHKRFKGIVRATKKEFDQDEKKSMKEAGGLRLQDLDEERPGLWANIHAKRERIKSGSGERMRKPGSKGAPSASDFKKAAGKE